MPAAPDPAAELAAALADAAALRTRLATAAAEADRLHGILRHLHGVSHTGEESDFIAQSVDVRAARACWPGRAD